MSGNYLIAVKLAALIGSKRECWRLGKLMTETQLWMVYSEHMISHVHHKLKDDRESLEDDLCIEQPAALWNEDNVKRLKVIMCPDHHQQIQMNKEKVFMLLSSEGHRVCQHFL
jgi:hypothetical protein